MSIKSTEELEKILGETHVNDIDQYISDNSDSIISEERPFTQYFKSLIKIKKKKQSEIFLDADIPERYGYKLLTEEKKTKQRDIILRLCYAANFTLDEVQHALKLYQMPELYAKIPRDAILMIAFNEHPGNIMDLDELLAEHDMEKLKTSGCLE